MSAAPAQPSTGHRSPKPALRSVCELRARWRDERTGTWYTADDTGICTGLVEALRGEVEPLDFDTAIDLSYRYLEEADLAETRGDAAAEEQWAMWAEQLQIWAARSVGAPGRAGTVSLRRSSVHHDEQAVSFAAMTRRN